MNECRSGHVQCDACDLPASVDTGASRLCASCAATMVLFVIDPDALQAGSPQMMAAVGLRKLRSTEVYGFGYEMLRNKQAIDRLG